MSASAAVKSDYEDQLIQDVAQFYDDPLGFALWAFDWGEGDLEEHDGPDDNQRLILKTLGQDVRANEQADLAAALRTAVASGHGIGKGAVTAMIILWAMSTRPHLTGMVTANTKTQLTSKTWRELAIWHDRARNKHWFRWTATKIMHVGYPSTWFVEAVPWSLANAQAFAGMHGKHVLLIFDEASTIDRKIWEVSEGAMTTRGAMWLVFGNPTENTGPFRECFSKDRARWRRHQIDSRTSRFTNKAEIDLQIQRYGEDSDFVRVRVRGLFPRQSATQLISYEDVESAQEREPVLDHEVKVIGVDVARYGDDQTVIALRVGSVAAIMARYRGKSTMQTVDEITAIISQVKPAAVFIDDVGVGGGVVDRLKQLRYEEVIPVNAGHKPRDETHYFNKRAEMYGRLAEWLHQAGCIPADDQDLADDLVAVQYRMTGKTQIQLERKEDMKKRGEASPDSADALALTFAQEIAPPKLIPQWKQKLLQRQEDGGWNTLG